MPLITQYLRVPLLAFEMTMNNFAVISMYFSVDESNIEVFGLTLESAAVLSIQWLLGLVPLSLALLQRLMLVRSTVRLVL
jgi:hypothetical protein